VAPPWYKLFGYGMTDVPIGIGYLAAVLRKNNISVDIYNADYSEDVAYSAKDLTRNFLDYIKIQHDLEHPIWKKVAKVISSFAPDVVGLTATTGKFTSALNVARICKAMNPNIKVVVGGPGPSCLPDETIKEKEIDFVVMGEGEYTFLELVKILESGESFSKCLGLAFKSNGNVVSMPARPLINNIDDLPFPVREFYINEKETRKPTIEGIMFATRGCPFRCIFCASHVLWTRRVRHRSVENIISEMQQLAGKYRLKYIKFNDDAFTVSRSFVLDFCDELIRRKVGVEWECSTRIDLMTEEILGRMKDAGCAMISVGVESGSDETLKKIKKGVTKKQIIKGFETAKKVGMSTGAFVMAGFPWENEKDIYETVTFARSLEPALIFFSIVTPYPSTELFDICDEMKILPKQKNWEEFYHQSPSLILNGMTSLEFNRVMDNVEKIVEDYNRKSRRRRLVNIKFFYRNLLRYYRNPKVIYANVKKLL
jgi:anaerobic magnesium-protoporphyrin IX monomethyl ester cyclase